MKSVFIFRRDFRLNDNLGLIECIKHSKEILPIFILTPEQITNNEYFSNNGFQFMLESLNELDVQYFYGDNISILTKLLTEYKYTSIFFNKDYTLYSQKRDNEINNFCIKHNIECHMIEDYLLLPINSYLKNDGTTYLKYTPFKDNAKKIPVPLPIKTNVSKIKITSFKSSFQIDINTYKKETLNTTPAIKGGRINGLKILKNMSNYIDYDKERNDLITPTTHLSAYIKFGCISIREVYEIIYKLFGIEHGLINQLYWREFYYYLAYYNPHVLEGKSLKLKYNNIKWDNNTDNFNAWCNGVTGFPSVDSGMRELNKTGYMHNRTRLITSSILIKILNCDWRMGEKYFATKLIDYDPIVNNGNWQWSAGCGADSQPYFRIFSPWQQAIDNDPECLYIKKWIPELSNIPNKDILKWDEARHKYNVDYPAPIVDYKKMRVEIIDTYKKGLM
mgnify:CR=1 FL=1